jgi:Fic family protein
VEVYKLKKPQITQNTSKALDLLSKKWQEIHVHVAKANHPEYLFWDKARYKHPPDVTPEEFWTILKLLRQVSPGRARTPVIDVHGNAFTWQPLPGLDHFFHEVDMNLGGLLESTIVDDRAVRQRFITRGLMEEAIASSQLEGAHVTRKVAKRMLIERRKPRDQSEQMILNNYEAMLLIEERLKFQDLTLDTLLDLHTTLTRNTIDHKDVGRLRSDADRVVVTDPALNVTYHIPPPEKFLKRELNRLIRYANDSLEKEQFLHPVIKAIVLHFWIGYLHPFIDGNGRVARAVFYWYLLRKHYWAFAYLPLSIAIKNSPAQYGYAYIYSEQDDNDLNYFIDYNVRKISQAKREFEVYLTRKQVDNRIMAGLARGKYGLNDRQVQLLSFLHKDPDATSTIRTHAQVNEVSRITARKDLEQLEKLGLVRSEKIGRERPFRATEKLLELFG